MQRKIKKDYLNLDLDYSEIIFEFVEKFGIIQGSTYSEFKDMIRDVQKHSPSPSERHIFELFSQSCNLIDSKHLSILLNVFRRKLLNIYEIINILYSIQSILKHFTYYEELLKTKAGYKERVYDPKLTENYMSNNKNKLIIFLLEKFKTDKLMIDPFEDKPSEDEADPRTFYCTERDKRRSISIDNKGYFNYIPYMCMFKIHTANDENCPFAHNKNELMYHPLLLKIFLCKAEKCSNEEYCNYAHNQIKDFRVLFNKKNPNLKNIVKIYKESMKTQTPKKKEISEENLIPNLTILPAEYHPDSYKTVECPLGEFCRLDKKLCLNYHNISERRRDLRQIQYDSTNCKNIFIDGKFYDPKKCNDGDKCKFSHTMYEFMYHSDNFRTMLCPFEKKGLKCEYIIICPYTHNDDATKQGSKMCYNSKTLNNFENLLKFTIKKEKERFIILRKVIGHHSCIHCKSDLKHSYNILNCCKKIICETCKKNSFQSETCNNCKSELKEIKSLNII